MILLNRNWLLKHLLALVMLLAMLWLGFWQLDRLEQKRSYAADLLAATHGSPIILTGAPVEPEAMHFRRVRVTGIYDNAESIVWRNQMFEGTNGVHVLTPLRIRHSDYAVMVDRGWLPQALAGRDQRSEYAVTGEVTVEGIAQRGHARPTRSFAPRDLPLPGQSRIDAWLRVDLDQIQAQLPYPLLPIFVVQLPVTSTPPDQLPSPVSPGQPDAGPHLSYALQWFTFSGLLIVIYALLLYRESKAR